MRTMHDDFLEEIGSDSAFICRPLPPIPNMEISERMIGIVADELQIWLNCVLSIAHDITIGRNLKVFLKVKLFLYILSFNWYKTLKCPWLAKFLMSVDQVALSLWFVSFIGSLFNFLTLVYIGKLRDLFGPITLVIPLTSFIYAYLFGCVPQELFLFYQSLWYMKSTSLTLMRSFL